MRKNGMIGRGMKTRRGNERGIALVMALIVTLVAFLVIGSTLYLVMQSTTMSGAGKTYASAEEAGDGSVNVMKDCINLVNLTETCSSAVFPVQTCKKGAVTLTYDLTYAITADTGAVHNPCEVSLSLPGTTGTNYGATLTVERLGTITTPGSQPEFPPRAGIKGAAVLYRVTTKVVGSNNTAAENTILYRYVPR